MFCASAPALLALALLAGTRISHADAVCNSTSCGGCSEDECSNTPGCFDRSTEDYDAQYCVECSGPDCGEHDENSGLDSSLGCTAEDNVIVAALMGFMGGAFIFILPCCGLCFRAQKQWADNFLSAPETKVQRTSALLKRKWIELSQGSNSTTSHNMFEIEFVAKRRNGTTSTVAAKLAVQDSTYAAHEEGGRMEVAYAVDKERDFVITEDLKERTKQAPALKILGCVLCCFASVGLLVGAASWPLTGCFVGLIPLVLLVIIGAVAGKWVMFPLMRKLTQSSFYVTVTPQAAGAQ